MKNLQAFTAINKDYFIRELDSSVETYFADIDYDIKNIIHVLNVKSINLSKIGFIPRNISAIQQLVREVNSALNVSKDLLTYNLNNSFLNFLDNLGYKE